MKKTDTIAALMLSIEIYQKHFKIKKENGSLIGLTTSSKSCDFIKRGIMEKTIELLIKLQIPVNTGMSITELLNCPTYVLKCIINSSRRIDKL